MVVNYFDYKKSPLVLRFKQKKRRKEKENGIVKYNKYVNVKFISSRRRAVNIPICCIINTFFSFWQKAFSKCRSSVADPNEICKQISRHAVYFMQILSSIKSEDISILLYVNLQQTHYMLYGDERIQMGWSLCYLFVCIMSPLWSGADLDVWWFLSQCQKEPPLPLTPSEYFVDLFSLNYVSTTTFSLIRNEEKRLSRIIKHFAAV